MTRGSVVVLLASALLGCGGTTLDLSDPERDLIAHWALDETTPGATVVDSSGRGHSGTPSTSPPWPSPNVPPGATGDPASLSFNGVDQLVEFGNPVSMQVTGTLTIATWINPAAVDGRRSIVAHGYRWAPYQEVSLRILDGYYQIVSWDGVDHQAQIAVATEDIGTWIHLCGVYDGTSYLLYRNGLLVASKADPMGALAVDAPWAIGARPASDPPAASRFFAGLLDDVRVYGRALAASEVAKLARAR